MLTLQEAAQKSGVSEKTLRRAIGSGKLAAHQREVEGTHNNQPFMIDESALEVYIAFRQPAQTVAPVDPTLTSRLAELKQTVQRMQMDAVSDHAYTSNRLDHYGQQITDMTIYLSKVQQENNQLKDRVQELEQALQETQDMVIRLSNQGQTRTVFPVEIHEFAERHHIPWSSIDAFALRPIAVGGEQCLDEKGQALFWKLYHDTKIWTPCPDCPHGNTKKEASIPTHAPVAQPMPVVEKETSVPAPDTETTFELADFSQLMQHEYRSSATWGDVKAWLTLRPAAQGIAGDYRIVYFESGRADGKRGQLKGDQIDRGDQLKSALRLKVVQALYDAGWQGGPFGIYACPKPVQS